MRILWVRMAMAILGVSFGGSLRRVDENQDDPSFVTLLEESATEKAGHCLLTNRTQPDSVGYQASCLGAPILTQ